MSKYKPGDKFEIEVISESAIQDKCYLTKTGIIPEGMLDMLKKIEPTEPEEPEVDWSKVKVDTPILVKDRFLGDWVKRYFEAAEWKYVKLAEVEK